MSTTPPPLPLTEALRALDLPAKFLRHNESKPAWLRDLPALIEQLAARWSLGLDTHFPGIHLNYVAPATRADGTRCVMKVSRHVGETRNEIAALRVWDGDGAARLLHADPEIGALLIERLEPGTMLSELVDGEDSLESVDAGNAADDRATTITAGVLRRLWRPAPHASGLRSLESWCAGYDRNREALSRGAGGFPAQLFLRADALRRELLASTREQTVLHGDMHHFNVLRADGTERTHGAEPVAWLAIDPKGLAGDRCFDVCQFLHNPHQVTVAARRRRLDIFCAELGLDRARTNDWCFVHAMLNACWHFEDGGAWQDAVTYVEETLRF
ncbi:MAG: Aminoglycoside 6-phosphotransferase, putative [uncultured Chloroflexi bacterium]|uniref:Aminoglycoside 6-phosphotransferase, putative n=1 Tax=uncultured Chloroflexota bacterium TaxID=166587 RepID=A0A6J4J6N1_9CHLR|nr:MAG: Aminoglycoside 6-phosphotransferase, putative [uncultured Chloroflexota bacterium]